MRAGTRVALYGLLLVALFVVSALLADVLVPASWVDGWTAAAAPGR